MWVGTGLWMNGESANRCLHNGKKVDEKKSSTHPVHFFCVSFCSICFLFIPIAVFCVVMPTKLSYFLFTHFCFTKWAMLHVPIFCCVLGISFMCLQFTDTLAVWHYQCSDSKSTVSCLSHCHGYQVQYLTQRCHGAVSIKVNISSTISEAR